MTCATKELYDRDEKEKNENEKHNKGVRKRVRFHLLLQECTRRDGLQLSTTWRDWNAVIEQKRLQELR